MILLLCPGIQSYNDECHTECNANYHHNFVVRDGERCHYPGVPNIVNINEHQFAERALVQEWINMMLVAWWVFECLCYVDILGLLRCGICFPRVSATNCAQIYNMTHPPPNDIPWNFSLELKTDAVWTAFVALCLLEDCERRHELLRVPHVGDQRDRYTEVMKERNHRIQAYGQPSLLHFCDGCLRIWQDPENPEQYRECSGYLLCGSTLIGVI